MEAMRTKLREESEKRVLVRFQKETVQYKGLALCSVYI